MRQGSCVAIAAACLLGWTISVEVRAGEVTECQPEEPAICDDEPEREGPVIYPTEFIEAPEAVFRLRCRHAYWQAILLNLRPFYPEFCPDGPLWVEAG